MRHKWTKKDNRTDTCEKCNCERRYYKGYKYRAGERHGMIHVNIPFCIGTEVITKKISWEIIGDKGVVSKVDTVGIITSVKGMKNHDNIHLYEVTYKGGKYYTDNLRMELTQKL